MAIVFASVAGIAGREAISNFVDRFIVPRPPVYGRGKGGSGITQPRSGSRDVQLVDVKGWQKTSSTDEAPLVVRVTEVSDV